VLLEKQVHLQNEAGALMSRFLLIFHVTTRSIINSYSQDAKVNVANDKRAARKNIRREIPSL
jgi:hypothetical protein